MEGGVESFFGMDSGEPMSEEAFEKFKERMKGAAKDLKAWQKGEAKQKKKEDELIKILLKYIKKSHKENIVLLISRMLEQNIPAALILAIILLGDKEIQNELNIKLLLPDGKKDGTASRHKTMLTVFGLKDETLPLKAKIEFDFWVKNLFDQTVVSPHKIIKTLEAKDLEGKLTGKAKIIAIQLLSFILRNFLRAHGISFEFEKLREFADFVLAGMLKQIHNQIDNQKMIG